jgi:hypothetical protein
MSNTPVHCVQLSVDLDCQDRKRNEQSTEQRAEELTCITPDIFQLILVLKQEHDGESSPHTEQR